MPIIQIDNANANDSHIDLVIWLEIDEKEPEFHMSLHCCPLTPIFSLRARSEAINRGALMRFSGMRVDTGGQDDWCD